MPRRVSEGPGLLLLDTHVWVWYVEGTAAKLSRRAVAVLKEHDRAGRLYISPVSAWEVATLVAKRRLTLSLDVHTWVRRATDEARVRTAELTAAAAVDAALLNGDPPRDPADRLLIATARALGAALVTCDARVLSYAVRGHVAVLDASA